jgi:hypothetical protein
MTSALGDESKEPAEGFLLRGSFHIREIKRLLKQPIVVDLRNVDRPNEMKDAGIIYYSLGRGPVGADAIR